MKIYVWIDKRLYFHNMETKKFEKKKVGSSIEPPSAKSYSSVSGQFFHSGSHILVQLLFRLHSIHPQFSLITGPCAFTKYYAYFSDACRFVMIYRSPKALVRWLLENTDMKLCLSFPHFVWEGAHPLWHPPPWAAKATQ